MKKLIVLLALCMVISVIFVACDSIETPENPTTDATTQTPTTEATTNEPTTNEPTTDVVTDEPTTDEPTTDEPTTQEPTTEEPTTDEPTTDEPTTEESTTEEHNSLKINLAEVGITGSYPTVWAGNGLATTPALNATDSMVVLHYGSINLGEIDLSKYTKVTITYGNMVGAHANGNYDDEFNATQKRVLLLNAPSSIQEGSAFEYLPEAEQIITYTNYEQSEGSLVLRTVEIDLSTVDYNGQTYLTFDFRNDANAFGYLANLVVVTGIVFE